MSMEDEKIIDLFFARDEDGIREASGKYGAYLRTVAYRILRNEEDTEECVNDTWVRAWNSIPPSRPTVLRAFLAKITRNLSLNRLEEQNALKRGFGETALCLSELGECVAGRSSVEEELDRELLEQAIDRFLKSIPADRRNLFLQRYFLLYSIQELAEMRGWGESRCKTALFRIRNSLKEYLEKEGFVI